MRVFETDILIIGSGAAGILAAIEASRSCCVTLVTKGPCGRDGATITAQADIAVDGRSCKKILGLPEGDSYDSPNRFASDIFREGEELGNKKLIEIQTESIASAVAALRDDGLHLRGLFKNPGHTYPRSVWISAPELCFILRNKLKATQTKVMEYTVVCDLLTSDGAVTGALAFDRLSGTPLAVRARETILCTGGAMRIYPYATAPLGLTGDGIAMAYRAGAELLDMEFPMFLPYALLSPKMLEGATFTHDLAMLTNAYALNRAGERFISAWDPERMERTTRDINSAACGVEIAEGRGTPLGGIWLSLAHLPANIIEVMGNWFPEGLSRWRYGPFDLKNVLPDLSRDALETIPASHFWNGGVAIGIDGSASIPGLYAAGEGTAGLHGANRISGNGIGQAIVWGIRAGQSAASRVAKKSNARNAHPKVDLEQLDFIISNLFAPLERKTGVSPVDLARDIRSAAWKGIGLVRDEVSMRDFEKELSALRETAANQAARTKERVWNEDLLISLQNINMLDVASCVVASALRRSESRGAHYRKDCPYTEDFWDRSIKVKRGNNGFPLLALPDERKNTAGTGARRPYGQKKRMSS
ncbi:MAG: FAD-binding protein [Synergistaceae bacterium]|nr:FAD-binding protein [Synergistaceae bacterium]